jgi:hypothetical protein
VACPDLQYFSKLSRKRHDFRKEKVMEYNILLLLLLSLSLSLSLSLQHLTEKFLNLIRIQRDIIGLSII